MLFSLFRIYRASNFLTLPVNLSHSRIKFAILQILLTLLFVPLFPLPRSISALQYRLYSLSFRLVPTYFSTHYSRDSSKKSCRILQTKIDTPPQASNYFLSAVVNCFHPPPANYLVGIPNFSPSFSQTL